MIMLKRIMPLALAAGTLLLTGCYPEGPDYISDYDLVYTNYSPSFDFKAARTYSLPDSVPLATNNLAEGELPEFVQPLYGNVIINQLLQNMNERGWERVGVNEDPDVVLLPAVMTQENVSYYANYWGWYYPYYGYGWYYPGYYPSYTSYTSGSLVLLMTVPEDVDVANNTAVVWFGVINSILEGSSGDLVIRLEQNIDQAFTQSEYLKH
jgi:hypothetical protein